MGGTTRNRGFASLLRMGFVSAACAAGIVSCSESTTAPQSSLDPALKGVKVVVVNVPDSLKRPWLFASASKLAPLPSFSRDVTGDAAPPASLYMVSAIEFKPEPSPRLVLLSTQPDDPSLDCGDCVAFNVPIGFDFKFYGNTYNQVDVSSNGLVAFGGALGSPQAPIDGCCMGWGIPGDDTYNNIIALAWTDWQPSKDAPVTVETQGTAPNRKFVLQWNGVPEYLPGSGRLTAQLVLYEGSNDIVMYTTSMNVTNMWHWVTQGIENADGSEAAFLPGRVQEMFSLSNDATRFSIRPVGTPFTMVPPANLEVRTDASLCSATFTLAQPQVSGGGDGLTVVGTRNDKLALDAAYPKGVTTVTWAATDAAGTTQLATQTITVVDREAPVITPPADIVVPNDPGLATANVNVGSAQVRDNCPNYSLNDAPNGVYPVGSTQALWTAVDESGNIGSAKQLVTVVDVEPPTVTVSANLTVNATSAAGAVVSFENFGRDNVGVTSFACDQVSGGLFPIGTTSVSCSALDAAGNRSAPATFTVKVLGAPDQIVNLIEFIRGMPIPEPQRTQLVNALQSALSDPKNLRIACPALTSVVALVKGNTPVIFSAEKNAQIAADVARIQTVLGCP